MVVGLSNNNIAPQIRYDDGTQKLHVTVVKCEALPKKDVFGASDPFVRVYLMPGTHTELKTKVVKNSANPLYNDEFSFVVRGERLCLRTPPAPVTVSF